MIGTTPDNIPDNLFRVLFEKSPGSLLMKANPPDFTIVAASDSYLRVNSLSRENVLGKGFFDVYKKDIDESDDLLARKIFNHIIRTGEKVDVPVYRFDIFEPGADVKTLHYWSFSNNPISSGNSREVSYILSTFTDITAEVKAKEAAQESEHRLLLAAEATGMAFWELTISDNAFSYSQQMAEIFGHPPGTAITLDHIRAQVHPDDMENIVIKAFQKALIEGSYFYEVRVYWPDESLHWIRTKGTVQYNKNKEPVRMLGTIVDITESKRDEIRKNDFIAMASHELKTPLTSLKAYLQLMETKLSGTTDPFVKTAVVKSGNQVNKMTALIHGFLDLSRIEPGKLKLIRTTFDICALIDEVLTESRVLSNTHSLRLESTGELTVNADRAKIGQVISNLVNNAIKYSPRGSYVILQCKANDGDVVVSVTDEGIGIKPKDQEKIFQRFYRAEEDEYRNISGFGIGLYLSSEIIQQHKGKIWVKSTEGEGSTFYFSLPVV
ncbi:MAG: PAS domain-containing protein [Bacteroidetes bacterium]|jgi:two-component system CheB/CheR fusion protein|nr:PAS domain-containing protein [Bacteroidota bacterium]